MATATQEANDVLEDEQEQRQELTGIDTGTLVGILAGTFLIVVAIIRGGDAGIFINLNRGSFHKWGQKLIVNKIRKQKK